MKRTHKPFVPSIPVKTKLVTRRVQLDPEMDSELSAYCDYYATLKGVRPDEATALVALARSAIQRDRVFPKWREEQSKPAKK